MRIYESIQRSENGGSPTHNDGPFRHGETVVTVSKRELATFAHNLDEATLNQLKDLGKDFVDPIVVNHCPECEESDNSHCLCSHIEKAINRVMALTDLADATQKWIDWADKYETRANDAKPPFNPWDEKEKPMIDAMRKALKVLKGATHG